MRWRNAAMVPALVGILWGFSPGAAHAATRQPPPRRVSVEELVTLTNTGTADAVGVNLRVVLAPPKIAYALVSPLSAKPALQSVDFDPFGNRIGLFTWAQIPPGGKVTLRLHGIDQTQTIAFPPPDRSAPYSVTSPVYQRYTSAALERSQGIDTGTAPIVALDRALIHPGSPPYQQARVLFDWVVRHIHYNNSQIAAGSALATLSKRSGTCTDFAELYVSMLRTDHIPARIIDGYVTDNGGGNGGFHQWVEWYLPQAGWVPADPTWGIFGYFARMDDNWHVPLYAGIRQNIVADWDTPAKTRGSAHLAISSRFRFQSNPPAGITAPLPTLPNPPIASATANTTPASSGPPHPIPPSAPQPSPAGWCENLLHFFWTAFKTLLRWPARVF